MRRLPRLHHALRAALVAALVLSGDADTSQYGTDPATNATLVYVATRQHGIHFYRLQTEGLEVSQNITLVPLGVAADTPAPGAIEIDQSRRLLFATNDVAAHEGKPSGAVSAFAVESTTGKLTLLNQRPSLGARPCRLALDSQRRSLFVANCASATVAMLPVAADGRLGEAVAVSTPPTSGPNGDSADTPDARCLALDPGNRFLFVCDTAGTRLMAYRFDAANGALAPTSSVTSFEPGAAARDLVFRPDGKFAYVGIERTSKVTAFAYDAGSGALSPVQTVSTVPEYYDGPNAVAEVDVHPTGRYLYVSNRGHNSIVLFTVDQASGALTYVEEQMTGGKNPRHFGIEPSARHLAIANQDSNQLLASRIDAGNGRLKPSGVFASAPSPVFVTFLPPPGGGGK